jgi:potassium/hydrogen antiporter
MELTNQIILVAGLLLLVSVLASAVSARVGMPMLLVFLILGMLAGEEGPGGIAFHDIQTAHLVGTLALAVILLDGGLRTEVGKFRVGLWPAVTLATLGVVATAVVVGLFAAWLLDLHWLEGLLIGAIIGSTDAAAVFGLLHAKGLELKQRVGATLEIESGSNDPMAVFLTIALVELLAAGHTTLYWTLLSEFALQMGLGAIAGIGGGYLLSRLIDRLSLAPGLYPLLALGGGLLIFGAAAVVNGSGFLAIYLAGLVIGNRTRQAMNNIRRFHDGMALLSQIGMFLILGLLVTPSDLLPVVPAALLVALVLIFVARPLAVAACLLPFRFPLRDQAYIGWVGLRGAVPIILALFPLLAGLEQAYLYFNIVFFVVLVSLMLQGWTVAPAARLLGLEVPPTSSVIERVELDIPGQPDYELIGYELAPNSPVVGRAVSRLALPASARPICVIRDAEMLDAREAGTLHAGDCVYLLAPRRELQVLDRLFIAVVVPGRLEEQRFFGEFVLDGTAHIGDVAAFYGFQAPPEAVDATIEEHLHRAFVGRPVVGDRLRLGSVELVVREISDNRVRKVGLKLLR